MELATERARNIPPFIVMDVLEKAHEFEREGRHIIHMEIGEPDFPTPKCICEAAVKAILINSPSNPTGNLLSK